MCMQFSKSSTLDLTIWLAQQRSVNSAASYSRNTCLRKSSTIVSTLILSRLALIESLPTCNLSSTKNPTTVYSSRIVTTMYVQMAVSHQDRAGSTIHCCIVFSVESNSQESGTNLTYSFPQMSNDLNIM